MSPSKSRKITITSALAFCNWNKYRINLVDTPGFINFIEDTKGCLRVVDGAVILVSAISGVKAETEKVWKCACEYEIPRIVFINKMDKDTANFERALDEIQKSFETEPIPLQIPIGAGETFSGIVDLITMWAFRFDHGKMQEGDIPAEIQPDAEQLRKKLVEKIAEGDDALLERYLEGGELTQGEILKGIRRLWCR